MQFSTSVIAAAAAFLPLIKAHMVMVQPPIFPGNSDNSPLDESGSNFPCKFPGGIGSKAAATATFTPGVSQNWKLKGSAVHGGGSCQISITYDNPPTKDSVFKVVQSYEGGCPMSIDGNNGNNPEQSGPEFPVVLPEGLKAGEASFVWTWFNKVGNREMYMNCAPITIGGSGSDDSVFDALPNMFVANINNAPNNACTTSEGVDIVFPNAGNNVIVNPAGNFDAACAGGPTTPGGGNGGTNPPPAQSSAPVETAAPAPTTAPGFNEGPGGVSTGGFSVVAPTMAPPAQTTMMTVTMPVAQPTQPVSEAPVPAPTQGSSNGSMPFQMGPCKQSDGIIVCGSSSDEFMQCYGDNMLYGPFKVPTGMDCTAFKATQPMSSRLVRKNLARLHRRNMVHGHSA